MFDLKDIRIFKLCSQSSYSILKIVYDGDPEEMEEEINKRFFLMEKLYD